MWVSSRKQLSILSVDIGPESLPRAGTVREWIVSVFKSNFQSQGLASELAFRHNNSQRDKESLMPPAKLYQSVDEPENVNGQIKWNREHGKIHTYERGELFRQDVNQTKWRYSES